MNNAINALSTSHGHGPKSLPRKCWIHHRCGRKNASPNANPRPALRRAPAPFSTSQNTTNAGTASHQNVRGGKLRASAPPATAAAP
jgi:hypothetical protein